MIVSSQILQLPNLKTEEEQKIIALIMQYFEPALDCFTGDINDELIKNICTCIEHILCIHKAYKLLDALTTFMKNSPSNLRSKFSIYLSTLLLDLFNKESDTNSSNAKELQKALQVLNIENVNKTDSASPFVLPTGRSARIAHMAKSSPKSPKKRGKTEPSPTALRLFGKDVDTLSSLPVKGSQLNIATPRSKKILSTLKSTPRNVPSINDEKSSDFVPIDTEVKFQPEKLNRHQKEVMRKRREDIPALYQDLSQSLSQDIFSSSSSSKGFDKTEQASHADKRKVIVEVIGDQLKSDAFPVEEKSEVQFHATPEVAAKNLVQSMNVPNLFSDAALSSEIIPEAPIQTIEDLIPNTDLSFEANLFPDAMLPSEITSDEAVQVKEITVPSEEVNTEESMNHWQVGSHKMLDSEETMIQEEKEITENSEIESKSKNIVADLEHKEKLISQKSEVHVEKEPYQIEVVVEGKESAKSEAEEKEKRRKQKIELELQKLRMDIVGAEEFLAASRRTRTREKPKKLDDISAKKNKTAAKEDKQSPQRQQTSRKSYHIDMLESKESILEKNRRKTISTIQDAKNVDISRISALEDKFNKPKDFDTPKTRRKRSGKYKLDDNKIKSNEISLKEEDADTSKKRENPKKIFGEDETIHVEKGQKRKRSTGDEESEDIIESSQEFQVLTPVFNVSKRKSLIDTSCIEQKLDKSEEKTVVQQKTVTKEDFLPVMEQNLNEVGKDEIIQIEEENKPTESNVVGLVTQESSEINHDDVNIKQTESTLNEVEEGQTETNTSQDTTVTQDSTQDLTQEGSQGEDADVEQSSTQDTQTQSTQTQETATQSEFSTVSEDTHPPVLYFDLPKKPELTESERMMCRMDTMSICMDPKNLPLKIHSDDHFVEGFEIAAELPKDQKLSMDMEDVLGKRCYSVYEKLI